MLADVAAVTGMKTAILRYFNVAGADPQGRYGQSTTKTTLLMQIVVQCALGVRDGFDIFGTDYPTPDGTCIRDFIHVSDLVDAHHLALQHLLDDGQNLLCNVGYGRGYSVKQVIDTVKEVAARDFLVRVAPARAGDPIESVADSSKIRQLLHWTPKYDDLSVIARHALAWEANLREKYRF
jgi:UDP-glucose 4-epimerase